MSEQTEGLSQHALDRLKGLRSAGSHEGVFTSDLSINEYLLVRDAGFEPVGMVMGSSVYHIGLQRGGYNQSMELTVLTQAMYESRELAMERMEKEAHALGADGIVGVRLEVNRYEWGADIAEFMAIGTAVVARESNANFRTYHNRPFTSDLSGQDFWTLLKAGYRPLSMVMGSCVYHVAHQGMFKSLGNLGRNVELPNFTQAMYDARELAMERMQKEAHDDKAEGVVGVQLSERSHGWGSHIIEFFSVGTAVTPTRDDHVIESPNLILSLND